MCIVQCTVHLCRKISFNILTGGATKTGAPSGRTSRGGRGGSETRGRGTPAGRGRGTTAGRGRGGGRGGGQSTTRGGQASGRASSMYRGGQKGEIGRGSGSTH